MQNTKGKSKKQQYILQIWLLSIEQMKHCVHVCACVNECKNTFWLLKNYIQVVSHWILCKVYFPSDLCHNSIKDKLLWVFVLELTFLRICQRPLKYVNVVWKYFVFSICVLFFLFYTSTYNNLVNAKFDMKRMMNVISLCITVFSWKSASLIFTRRTQENMTMSSTTNAANWYIFLSVLWSNLCKNGM